MIVIVQADLTNTIHAEHIISMLSEYATDIMGGGEDLAPSVKQNLIPALQKRNDVLIFLAYDNDIAVGLAICFEGFSTFYATPLLNIHDFAVKASHRGKGIARQLLEAIETTARTRKYCKLTLEVLEGNKRAQHIYTTFGFEAYTLEDDMGKALFWQKALV